MAKVPDTGQRYQRRVRKQGAKI